MSHTNSTPNYNLPQFIGTDKPAWLGDINPAMSAIDTHMKANADAITTNASDIDSLESDMTLAKQDIQGNQADIITIGGVASTANTTANQAKTSIENLTSYLTLTNFKNVTNNITTSGINIYGNPNLQCATNASGSVAKIYGSVEFTVTSTSGGTLTIATDMRPSSELTINGALFVTRYDTGLGVRVFNHSYKIGTDGKVTISLPSSFYNLSGSFNLLACLLFLKDFGDAVIQV